MPVKVKSSICISALLFILSLTLMGQPLPFKPGEKLTYEIRYGPITGGYGTLELQNDTFAGKSAIRSTLIAKTIGVADAVYRIKDVYEVYMDPATELPLKSIRNIREGRYRKYNVVLFDHNARADSVVLSSDLTGRHVAQKGIHDILTCFYYFRKNYLAKGYQFKPGEIVTIMTWFTDELYPIRLKYIGMEETKTKLGRMKCYMFNPVTEVGRLFKTNEDMTFWFSADKNFLPVKVRLDIFVGAFMVDLTEYEGLSNELEIITKHK